MFNSGKQFSSGKQRVFVATAASIATLGLLVGGASAASADDNGGLGRGGPFGSLVKAGTITAEQAQAVKAALKSDRGESRSDREAERKALVDGVLAKLVSAGTITSAQASALASADREGLRDLVSSGTVTPQVLRAVRDAMREAIEAKKTEHRAEKSANLASTLAGLVSDGTLTQAQSTAIQQAISQKMSEHKSEDRGKGRRAGR